MLPRKLPVVLLALLATPGGMPAQPPRLDAHGDPLPAGARARLGVVPLPHHIPLAAFSPDGTLLAAADNGGGLTVWHLATGQRRQYVQLDKRWPFALTFSADGQRLLALFRDSGSCSEIHAHNAHTGKPIARVELPWGSGPSFSPDGSTLALSSQEQANGKAVQVLALWDAATGKRLRQLASPCQAETTTFAADGRILVAVLNDGSVRRWEAATGKELGEGPVKLTTRAGRVVPSPDGKTVASGSGGQVVLWDTAAGRERATLITRAGASALVVFSADGKQVATTFGDGVVRLWDAGTGRERSRFLDEPYHPTSLAVSPGGRWVACVSYGRPPRVWEAATGRELWPHGGHFNAVVSLEFSADGKTLASLAETRTHVRLWDVATGKQRRTVAREGDRYAYLTFSPDSKTLAGCTDQATVGLWDADTGKELRRFDVKAPWVGALAFRPGGKELVTAGGDGTIRTWDTTTGRPGAVVKGVVLNANERSRPQFVKRPAPTGYALGYAAFAPGGRFLASVSVEGGRWAPGNATDFYVGGKDVVRIWETDSGRRQVQANAAGPTRIRFSADGKTLILLGKGTVKLWEAAGGGERLSVRVPEYPRSVAALSPDGRVLAAAVQRQDRKSGEIHLWETATGKELAPLTGAGQVTAVAFSPDGQTLASGASDGTILLWNVSSKGR